MISGTEEIFNAALALPAENRAALAEKLLDSLSDKERAEIDAAWTVEAERRLRDYDRGKVKGIPGEEILQSLRSRRKS